MKLPFIKFFPRDWQADTALRSCSIEARGVWIELLCIMAQSDRHGYLIGRDGKAMDLDIMSRLTGCFKDTLYTCLSELEESGVFDREENTGIMFSRRMAREEEKREFFSKCGKEGGGSPLLKKKGKKPNKDPKEPRTHIPEAIFHISIKDTFKPPFKGQDAFATACDALTPKLTELAEKWMQYKSERKEKYVPSGLTQLLKKMVEIGEARTEAAINFSMESNYAGMFEPKQTGAFSRTVKPSLQPRTDVDPSLRIKGYGQAVTLESQYGGDDE